MRFLRFHCHCGDRAGDEAFQPDRVPRNFAPAIFPLIDTAQSGVDLGDQFTLAIARAQFDSPIGFGRRAVVEIGFAHRSVLKRLKRLAGSVVDRFFPVEQKHAEVFLLPLVHIFFAVVGDVISTARSACSGQFLIVACHRGH